MKVEIAEQHEKLQVLIQCREINEQILRLKTYVEQFDSKIQAKRENEICYVEAGEVLYFETVDERVFVYTRENVLEVNKRLYELEVILPGEDFIRISKSLIVNVNKIQTLQPQVNRTILATMCNGEMLSISRKYVKEFKERILGVSKSSK